MKIGELTWEEAQAAMQQGKAVRHKYFEPHEYLRSSNYGLLLHTEGVDMYSTEDFERYFFTNTRTEAGWRNGGWRVVE